MIRKVSSRSGCRDASTHRVRHDYGHTTHTMPAQAVEPIAQVLHTTQALPILVGTVAGFYTAQMYVTCGTAFSW